METSFHPSLSLVPLLANYPLSHYSPPSLGVLPSHPFSSHSSFRRLRVDISSMPLFVLLRVCLLVSILPVFFMALYIRAPFVISLS